MGPLLVQYFLDLDPQSLLQTHLHLLDLVDLSHIETLLLFVLLNVLELEVIYLKERRGMGKFECVAKVDGQVACEAMIMCARREI